MNWKTNVLLALIPTIFLLPQSVHSEASLKVVGELRQSPQKINDLEKNLSLLNEVIDAEVDASSVPSASRSHLLSMVKGAYQKKRSQPLWDNIEDEAVDIKRMDKLLRANGFGKTTLNFVPNPKDITQATNSPVALHDVRKTLQLAEICLLLKEGPASCPEWEGWLKSDYPGERGGKEFYPELVSRFIRLATVKSPSRTRVAQSFVPKNWVYKRLRTEYNRLSRAVPPPKLKVSGLVKEGYKFEQAGELAEWLVSEKHMTRKQRKGIDAIYTADLKEAVRAYQKVKGIGPDGILGPQTAGQIAESTEFGKDKVHLNMDRARRMPDGLGERYVVCNIPTAELYGYDNDVETIKMRVVVGKSISSHRTPIFRDELQHVIFRPYWNVPASITKNEYQSKSIDYLKSRNYQIVNKYGRVMSMNYWNVEKAKSLQYRFRQSGGTGNALGLVKFLFPNDHAVYFHDTQAKSLFSSTYRAYSHGCMRLHKPQDMANWVLGNYDDWNEASIKNAMYYGKTRGVHLEDYIPVYVTYFTVYPTVESETGVSYGRDYYKYDSL